MLKCCKNCKRCNCKDELDVSGFYCNLLENKRMNYKDLYTKCDCVYFKFDLLNFLFNR